MYTFSLDPRNGSKLGCLDLGHQELGSGGGCCSPSSSATYCTVKNYDDYGPSYCYCDETCYFSDDCCDDILEVGCTGMLPIDDFVLKTDIYIN